MGLKLRSQKQYLKTVSTFEEMTENLLILEPSESSSNLALINHLQERLSQDLDVIPHYQHVAIRQDFQTHRLPEFLL